MEAEQELEVMDIYTAMEETNDFLKIEFELEPPRSKRQQKLLDRNPVAYMVKKMRDSEVVLAKLTPPERLLFSRAKAKEVSSFLKNEAVHQPDHQGAVGPYLEADSSGRPRRSCSRRRPEPGDSPRLSGAEEGKSEDCTAWFSASEPLGSDLQDSGPRAVDHQPTPSLRDGDTPPLVPARAGLGHGLLADRADGSGRSNLDHWRGGNSPGLERWLRGHHADPQECLRLDHRSSGLWLSLHKKLTSLGAKPERCLWIWSSSTDKEEDGSPVTIGAMGGHVDDFHRIGNQDCAEWQVRDKINGAYQWGTVKSGSYSHAGNYRRDDCLRLQWEVQDHRGSGVLHRVLHRRGDSS